MKPNDKAIEAARKVVIQRATHNLFNPSFLFGVIEAALDAAYAAQFQSEEYAGLIERLRLRAGIFKDTTDDRATADAIEMLLAKLNNKPKPSEDYAGLIERLRREPERDVAGHKSDACLAADAIEALLAERDDFAEQLALRSESGMAKDMQEIMRINNELVAERDALAASLAPVEDEELVEIAAYYFTDGSSWSALSERLRNICRRDARNVIAAIRPHIEAAEREWCAKRILETNWVDADPEDIAAAIRSGK